MKIAIYPGTFDPITYGHIDVIKKSLNVFDKIVIATTLSEIDEPIVDEGSIVFEVDPDETITVGPTPSIEMHGLELNLRLIAQEQTIIDGINRATADLNNPNYSKFGNPQDTLIQKKAGHYLIHMIIKILSFIRKIVEFGLKNLMIKK